MENKQPYTPPFRGAIFDMDGTLVDNSPVHVRAFEIFCNRYHVEGWREKFTTAFGRGNDEIMPMLLPEEINPSVSRREGSHLSGDLCTRD